jgi:hypothetical protein
LEKPENKMMEIMDKHRPIIQLRASFHWYYFYSQASSGRAKANQKTVEDHGPKNHLQTKNLTKQGMRIYRALFIERTGYHARQSGMVHGYHLHPHAPWIYVPDSHHRCVQQEDRWLGISNSLSAMV